MQLDPSGVLTRSTEGDSFVALVGTAPEPTALEPIRPRPARRPGPVWWPAAAALAAAVVVIVLDAVAVSLAGSGSFLPATVLAWAAIALSTAAVVAGALAIVLGRGRRLAILAVVVGILANPFLLTRLLDLLAGR